MPRVFAAGRIHWSAACPICQEASRLDTLACQLGLDLSVRAIHRAGRFDLHASWDLGDVRASGNAHHVERVIRRLAEGQRVEVWL